MKRIIALLLPVIVIVGLVGGGFLLMFVPPDKRAAVLAAMKGMTHVQCASNIRRWNHYTIWFTFSFWRECFPFLPLLIPLRLYI